MKITSWIVATSSYTLLVNGFVPSPGYHTLWSQPTSIAHETLLWSTLSPVEDNAVSKDDNSRGRGGISMSVTELSKHVGGRENARLIWDLYSIGIEPENFFGDNIRLGYDDFETVVSLLPNNRGSLSRKTLRELAALYPGTAKIEGGVASLHYIASGGDGTTKILLKLSDGQIVETIIAPEGKTSTLTVSSHAGNQQGSDFYVAPKEHCRSLSSDEILAQMFFARKFSRLEALPPIDHVVFKGPGDASDNAEAVRNAAHIFAARGLFQAKTVKVTLSTMGPSPQSFENLSRHSPGVIAWRVHAVNDEVRRQLFPSTQYTMEELRDGLIDALCKRPLTLRRVSLEVTLLHRINDSLQYADDLAEFAHDIMKAVPGCRLSVDITPYTNRNRESLYQTPTKNSVVNFQNQLWKHDIEAHLTKFRGDH